MSFSRRLKGAYHIIKKAFDPVDDIAVAIRDGLDKTKEAFSDLAKTTLEFAIALIVGIVGIITHGIEFISAILALRAQWKYWHNNYQAWITDTFAHIKGIFSSYNFILSGTGLGVSTGLLIATLTTLPVAPLFIIMAPVLIPGLMFFIYLNNLIVNSIKLKNDLDKANKLQQAKIISDNEIPEFIHKQQTKVVFNALECLSSALVVIGLITGLLPLTIIGAGFALLSKFIEYKDKANDYKYSKGLRKFFSPQTEIIGEHEIKKRQRQKNLVSQHIKNAYPSQKKLQSNNPVSCEYELGPIVEFKPQMTPYQRFNQFKPAPLNNKNDEKIFTPYVTLNASLK